MVPNSGKAVNPVFAISRLDLQWVARIAHAFNIANLLPPVPLLQVVSTVA